MKELCVWSETNLVLERIEAIEMHSYGIMSLQLHNLVVVFDLKGLEVYQLNLSWEPFFVSHDIELDEMSFVARLI